MAMVKFPKRIVVTPPHNWLYTTLAITVSLFAFAYSTRFGKLPILALYGVWALPVAVEPRLLLRNVGAVAIVCAFAGLAIASTLWSDNPSTTLRNAIQYGTTIACAVIAARVTTVRSFAFGGLVGSAVVIAYSLHIGRYEYDAIDSTYALVGAFGSKNQLGFYASLGVLLGVVLVLMRAPFLAEKVLAAAVVTLAAFVLLKTQSATSVATIIVALAFAVTLFTAGRTPPTQRFLVLCAGGVLFVGVAAAALDAGAFAGVLNVFGKDATLTGRTYLWREGIIAAGENPILGMGYNAFWTHGFAHAERLWDEFYITKRTGFHFHNTYIEAVVGLGLVGLAALVGLLVLYWTLAVRAVFRGRLTAGLILTLAMGALLLMRSFVEIDFLTPYTVGTFLLYYSTMKLMEGEPVPLAEDAPSRPVSRPGGAVLRPTG
ncbi:O-antigen ligase family protein [Acuticoccus sp.]|uniref:O-antigen ligase family protein n=1 Tax=Acuticoccus sp. TaxID=1904378 RepID=UPI003B517891